MNEKDRINLEITELEQRLSDCYDDERLDDIGYYESEIERLTHKLSRLERTERKAKPNNSKWMF